MNFPFLSDYVMVLAAGFGKRLYPLTTNTPKPLLKIGDKALLDYHLDTLKDLGFKQAVVNTHYLADQVHDHLEKKKFGMSSFEPVILDTGGGIANVIHHFDKPFLCINADAYTNGSYKQILKEFIQSFDPAETEAKLLISPVKNNRGYFGTGDFFCHQEQIMFRGEHSEAPFVFNGIQILSPSLFAGKSGVFRIHGVWKEAEAKKAFTGYVEKDSFWYDTGTLEGYKLAEELNKERFVAYGT